MKLYYSQNLNPRVAVAAARHLHSDVEFVRASPQSSAQQPAFRSINPNALVPVLVEDERTYWETDAIVCRLSMLARSDFWRTDDRMADMIMWISWGTHHLTKAADVLYWWNVILPTFSSEKRGSGVIDEALADFRRFAAILEQYLTDKTWLVDDRLSYADFRVATSLPFAEKAGLPLAEFPRMKRWQDQLLSLDAWRAPFDGLG